MPLTQVESRDAEVPAREANSAWETPDSRTSRSISAATAFALVGEDAIMVTRSTDVNVYNV